MYLIKAWHYTSSVTWRERKWMVYSNVTLDSVSMLLMDSTPLSKYNIIRRNSVEGGAIVSKGYGPHVTLVYRRCVRAHIYWVYYVRFTAVWLMSSSVWIKKDKWFTVTPTWGLWTWIWISPKSSKKYLEKGTNSSHFSSGKLRRGAIL